MLRPHLGRKEADVRVGLTQPGALLRHTRREIERLRPRSRPVNHFQFGNQVITTKVNMMVPNTARQDRIDVTAAMHESTAPQDGAEDALLANVRID